MNGWRVPFTMLLHSAFNAGIHSNPLKRKLQTNRKKKSSSNEKKKNEISLKICAVQRIFRRLEVINLFMSHRVASKKFMTDPKRTLSSEMFENWFFVVRVEIRSNEKLKWYHRIDNGMECNAFNSLQWMALLPRTTITTKSLLLKCNRMVIFPVYIENCTVVLSVAARTWTQDRHLKLHCYVPRLVYEWLSKGMKIAY